MAHRSRRASAATHRGVPDPHGEQLSLRHHRRSRRQHLVTESSFTEPNGGIIGRITPNGTITEFPLPNKFNSNPFPITAGPDGNLWFAELPPKIGRMTPTGLVVP